MASTATVSSPSQPQKLQASDISSVKAFIESNDVVTIPSSFYTRTEPHDDVEDDLAASIPVIDFSLLTSPDPQVHANTVRELGNACKEWGFFLIINHGIPEKLMEDVINKSIEFHNLPLEEKKELADEKVMITPIGYGTSIRPHANVDCWRDFLKVQTHPQCNIPHKPPGYKEAVFEYSGKIRDVLRTVLQGVSESLGLGTDAIVDSTDFDECYQTCQVNLYPPCPQADLALGFLPHTDTGLITLLIQNGIGGLQVKHDGKWVNVNPLPNCIVANTADQLEVVTNGRYKSVWHRVTVNEKHTRLSFALGNGPALENETGPAIELLEKEKPLFKSIKYKDYLKVQQEARSVHKRGLDLIRIN